MNEPTYPYVNEDDCVLTALSLIMEYNIFAIGVIRKNTQSLSPGENEEIVGIFYKTDIIYML